MSRLAIVAAVIAALLVGLVIALRIPVAEEALVDLPVVGGAFEALADLIGTHDTGPIEYTYRFDRAPSPEVLDAIRRKVAPSTAAMRGDKLVITVADIGEAMHAGSAIENAARLRKLQLFVVVFQSDELDRISKALRKDDQAKALELTVELDTVGYHLHAPDGMKMVNPAWAERHHCDGNHYEGTGTSCLVSARDRIDAYVHGDPDLFTDAHSDALAVPAGRAFYITNDGNGYELEAKPIEIAASQVTGAAAAGNLLELALTPEAAAAVSARANAPTVELVGELSPGILHPVTVAQNGLALTIAGAAASADDLLIASAGPHPVR